MCATGQSQSHVQAPLSADEVIRKAVVRGQQAEARASLPAYTYTKVSVTEEMDAAGKLRERKAKVYQVSVRSGSTQATLLEVNGHPPGPADLKKQAENATNLHQWLGGSKSVPDQNRENFLTPELVARFDFQLLDQITLDGRPTYRLTFQPKVPESPEHRLVDRLLNRITGTIWIDASEFEVARAEIQLRSEVDFLGGVLGRLKKMAYTLARTRMAEGIWLNTLSIGDFEGRKLLGSLRIKTKSESTNFRPLV